MAVFLRNSNRAVFKAIGSLVAVLALFAASNTLAQEVVSTSLCSDAYVLEVVEPERIKALSWQAGSPLSLAPKPLRSLAGAWVGPETLLALAPARLVFDAGINVKAGKLAIERGSEAFQLRPASNFAQIDQNRRQLAKFLGRTEQAEIIIEKQNQRIADLAAKKQSESGRLKVLYLTPTLGTAGSETLVDSAITAAGGINLATEYGISGWGQIPLEHLVSNPPDLIVSSFFSAKTHSVLQFRSNHSILRNLRKQVPVIHISGALWVCAGPHLITAAELIANELEQLQGRRP